MKRNFQKRKEHFARWIFAIATIVCAIVVAQYQTPLEKEIGTALHNAMDVKLSIGKFESSNGLTSSLSDTEISTLIQEFNREVDCYFTSGYFNATCKETNALVLQQAQTAVSCYTVDSGVLDLEVDSVQANDTGDRAIVRCTLTSYALDIQQRSDGRYYTSCPINGSLETIEMIKEDEQWKVAQFCNIFKPWESDSWYIRFTTNTDYEFNPNGYATFEEALEETNAVTIAKTKNPVRNIVADIGASLFKLGYSAEQL